MALVYRHRRISDLEVFYIGIGVNKRRPNAKYNRSELWGRYIKKYPYSVEIISDNISINEAKELEILLIQEYGRRDLGTGRLLNMTDGGDGSLNPSKESREATSKRMKGGVSPMKGRKMSKEARNRMSESKRGIKQAKNHVEKRVKSIRGKKLSKDRVEAIRKRMTGSKMSKETKYNLSLAKSKYKYILYDLNMVLLKEFSTITEAAEYSNQTPSTIHRNARGEVKNPKKYRWDKILNITTL